MKFHVSVNAVSRGCMYALHYQSLVLQSFLCYGMTCCRNRILPVNERESSRVKDQSMMAATISKSMYYLQ